MGVSSVLEVARSSETDCVQNLELFFCLYAQGWENPGQCNSTHSRLLGFFATLPGIWRALQCLRRYYDTRNAFPHLVNCGKYTFTILFYMSLSLYRIQQDVSLKALFITFATINSLYTCKSTPCILIRWTVAYLCSNLGLGNGLEYVTYNMSTGVLADKPRSLPTLRAASLPTRCSGLQTPLGVLHCNGARSHSPI